MKSEIPYCFIFPEQHFNSSGELLFIVEHYQQTGELVDGDYRFCLPDENQMGVGATSAYILFYRLKGEIVLSAGIAIFVMRSVFDWLLHRPAPSEIVGKVWGNQALLRCGVSPVAVVAGTIDS